VEEAEEATETEQVFETQTQPQEESEPQTLLLELEQRLTEVGAETITVDLPADEFLQVAAVTLSPQSFTPPVSTVKPVTAHNVVPAATIPLIPITEAQKIDKATVKLLTDLAKNLDETKQQFGNTANIGKMVEVGSVAVSSSLSVGYILWLLRSGVVVASMMSAMPAWRFIDPLPVLGGQDGEDEDDGESLETMVRKEKTEPNEKTPETRASENAPLNRQNGRLQ